MTGDEAALAMIQALNAAGIPYMLVGSFSSNFYGIPRSTQDADFVVELSEKPLSSLEPHLSAGLHVDPQLLFEGVTGTTRSVVLVAGTEFTIELFRLSHDPHDQERFRRRVRHRVLGCDTFLPTAEDVIVTKLRWLLRAGRNKDRDDLRDVIAVQGERLDWNYIDRWCDEHGTRTQLDEIRKSIPPI
ncbi:MAG: nucleotidyltransferase [Planctomycetaceae bacterium]